MPTTGANGGSRRSPSSPGRHPSNSQYTVPPPPPPNYPYNGGGPYSRPQGRGYGAPSGPPVVGWTPRAPGSARAGPSGNGRSSHLGNMRSNLSGNSRPVPSGGSRSAPAPSPRAPDANGTPSWLKGAYRPPKPTTPVPSSSPMQQDVDSWCKARLESIRAVVDGADALPELRKVMDDLEYEKIDMEAEIARKARRDRWRAIERMNKTDAEYFATERPIRRIDAAVEHVEAKIARLRSYSAFIDSNWTEGNMEIVPQSDS